MSFVCPVCDQSSLSITFSVELLPSGDDDEVTLQTVKCAECTFRGLAVYRESRHGSLDSESWQHDGYVISDEAMERLLETMLLCPSPKNRRCACEAHASLGKQDWSAPAASGIEVTQRFEMRRAR
jgi:hypothetical protein